MGIVRYGDTKSTIVQEWRTCPNIRLFELNVTSLRKRELMRLAPTGLVIQGNTNTYLESKHELERPVWASKIRFLPYSHHRRTVCMRVELYGCYWSDGVVSYSMPQGDKRGNGWEFFDATYDGHWDGELRRGLGQLTDGKTGPDNFKMGYYNDNDRAQGWVGWRNDSRGQPVEIKFEFDKVREFSAVHIYCNNQFTRDVQVFSQVDILFSIGGKYYTGEPITYTYMEDKIFETSRNITIKLHHRVGKFVKLRLHFSDRWIMISEVTFDSGDKNILVLTQETPLADDVQESARRDCIRRNLYSCARDAGYSRTTLAENPGGRAHKRSPSFLLERSLLHPLAKINIAHGNFTAEETPTTESPIQSDVFVEKNGAAEGELPVSTAKHDDPTFMAIVIGALAAVIIILALAIFMIISRHRQRKCFASPMTGKAPSHLGSTCATVEKGAALMAYTLEDDESYSTVVMEMKDMMLNNKATNINHSGMRRSNAPIYTRDYARTHAHIPPTHSSCPYTCASTHSATATPVPMVVHPYTSRQQSIRPDRNQYAIPFCARSSFAISSTAVYANGAVDTSYDYAVPELGTVPLLNQDAGAGRGTTISNATGDQDSLFSKNSRTTKSEDKKNTSAGTLSRIRPPLQPSWNVSSLRGPAASGPVRSVNCGEKARRVITFLTTPCTQPTSQKYYVIGVDFMAKHPGITGCCVPLFPRHRLRMLSKLAEGAFGTVYVAEAEGIPEYGTTTTLGKRLVAVKFLLPEASEKENRRSFVNGRIKLSRESAITKSIVSKPAVTTLRGNARRPTRRAHVLAALGSASFIREYVAIQRCRRCSSDVASLISAPGPLDFQRDVRILAALEDRNIARVLGACYREEPYCVVMEYLEHGDLCQFLKTHITAEDAHSMPIGVKTLSFNCLIYMAAQIASGMRYLENLNFVHRDLATRNCLVGKAYHIKISDFGTDNELYACDYYKVDGTMPLPVRWMAWESIFLGKYTTKSDVWAFAVTLWEILNLGRRVPYEHLSDEEVVQSLQQLHHATECSNDNPEDSCKEDSGNGFDYLPRPTASSKDIYDLMLECWRREENERPTFREISLFLQRKNLGYAPTS
ncbi:Discoidin domain-containing receptor [Ooceraea biroi]|uniref:Discoidin domain-containing receptor n=1 Tax=Ooceraea biroi TaxID=2015173 RepID=A0A026VZN5_OOCBI|nr:Discoidin domain-containing receptor [Ooceraea biroi]